MQFRDEQERLIAEQAVLAFRAVQTASEEAPFGDGLGVIEDRALSKGREFIRRLIETAASRRLTAEKAIRRRARRAGDARG